MEVYTINKCAGILDYVPASEAVLVFGQYNELHELEGPLSFLGAFAMARRNALTLLALDLSKPPTVTTS